jgi:hypothetical protein
VCKDGPNDSDAATGRVKFSAGNENQPDDAGTLRTEGHLLSPQGGGEGDDAVDAEVRQEHSRTRKRGDERGVEAAPRFQAQFYGTPLPRQVFQPAKVCAVPAPRHFAALWTTDDLLNVNIDQESAVEMLDLIQHQILGGQIPLSNGSGEVPLQVELK